MLGGLLGGWLAGMLGLQALSCAGGILIAALGGIVLVVIVRVLRWA